jgi:hypothetical protein
MFYWLDNFIQCLPPFSGHGFEPHLLHHFLTFYADLIKWTRERLACAGPPFCHL